MSVAIAEAKAAFKGLLVPLIKLALVGEAGDTALWRAEALKAQKQASALVGELPAHTLDDVWNISVKAAERDPAVRRDETVNPTLPAMSPLRADQLGAELFQLDEALQIIRDVASFG